MKTYRGPVSRGALGDNVLQGGVPVFLGLDCRASKMDSQGAMVLTPIVSSVVRRPPGLSRGLTHWVSLECVPVIPIAPGEEH